MKPYRETAGLSQLQQHEAFVALDVRNGTLTKAEGEKSIADFKKEIEEGKIENETPTGCPDCGSLENEPCFGGCECRACLS